MWKFDIYSEQWQSMPVVNAPVGRTKHAMVTLDSSHLFVMGGAVFMTPVRQELNFLTENEAFKHAKLKQVKTNFWGSTHLIALC